MPDETSLIESCAKQALGRMFASVATMKRQRVGLPLNSLQPGEHDLLVRSLKHLSDWLVPATWEEALVEAVRQCSSNSRGARDPRRNNLRLLGQVHEIAALLSSDQQAAARYFVAQCLALDLRHWINPLDALFYAVCQDASHRALRKAFDSGEETYTREFLKFLPERARAGLIEPFSAVSAEGLRGFHLRFATASMQEGPRRSDLQGADLAIVIGMLLFGQPVWKVVLMQAKKEKSHGRSDVSHKGGAQLAEILSTGMGAYLFYPTEKGERLFFPTVKLAKDVFAEAYRDPAAPELTTVDTRVSAWDFSSFVALEMRRRDALSPGRVFPSAKAVADALSIGRSRPVTMHPPDGLLIASVTPSLDVLDFEPLVGPEYEIHSRRMAASGPTSRTKR